MERRFTKDELEQLQAAEYYFNTVIQSAYKRATGGKLDTLVADIYDAATGKKIARNFSCGICSFNMYKQVGTKYFEDKKYYEQVGKELEPNLVNDSKSTENEDKKNNSATNKKQNENKRGRKGINQKVTKKEK